MGCAGPSTAGVNLTRIFLSASEAILILILFKVTISDHPEYFFSSNFEIFFVVEKDTIIKSGGHRKSWVAIFWPDPPLRGQIRGTSKK